ncbi:Alg5-prov protein [Endogone sp. FLAS-F59071]|nr:Alg5-prov protein [Endogone sp. FLAS-F59071]|eukprot:RUS22613.1 Alg5-prov protein [Endogone sp. FLAS-F59071]
MSNIINIFIGFIVLVVSGLYAFLVVYSPKPRPRTESEKFYKDATSKEQRLPTILDKPTVSLSVIVPAFDEKQRLPIMLDETVAYLEQRRKADKSFTYEILVVDDGSRDNTTDVALEFAKEKQNPYIRVLTLEVNRGKGGAVTQGMLSSGGELLLMVDADGATRFSDLDLLEKQLGEISRDGLAVTIGSRSHLVKTDAVVKRSFIRNFLMRGFHATLLLLGISGIADTQCGFKLFTRAAARRIFPNMHVERWIFDVEILLLAQMIHCPIAEVQVNWHEIDGSKVKLVQASIQMGMDLLVIRLNYLLGFWRVKEVKNE